MCGIGEARGFVVSRDNRLTWVMLNVLLRVREHKMVPQKGVWDDLCA
jgi:hypothetical protein